jgi:hypothetical protein
MICAMEDRRVLDGILKNFLSSAQKHSACDTASRTVDARVGWREVS